MTLADQEAYLKRIRYQGRPTSSFETLTILQRLHLLSVPFENLDIHLGRKIELENSFRKIVAQRRGGFCYELNGLFYQLLREIGFNLEIISGRVYNKVKRNYPPEFDHMAITVKIDGNKYLVDVGNGEFALQPLKVTLNAVQTDPRGDFIIEKSDGDYLLVSKIEDQQRLPQYLFTLQPRTINEFLPMLNYQQTSPESHFVQKQLCTLPTENGRITISGNSIKFKSGEVVREVLLDSEEAFHRALLDHFAIKL